MDTIQFEIDFLPGLTEQFPELIDLVASCVYGYRGGLTAVANELDISPSHLSRILSRRNPDDVRHFDIGWLPTVIKITGDMRPISWLIEEFMPDPENTRNRTMEQVSKLAGELFELLPELKSEQLRAVK